MKETKQRKAHLPEFKAKAGLEALSGEKTVNPIGKLEGRTRPPQKKSGISLP